MCRPVFVSKIVCFNWGVTFGAVVNIKPYLEIWEFVDDIYDLSKSANIELRYIEITTYVKYS